MHERFLRATAMATAREIMCEEASTRKVQTKKSDRDLRRELWDKTRRYLRRVPKIVLSNPERVAETLAFYRSEAASLGFNPDMLIKAASFQNAILS